MNLSTCTQSLIKMGVINLNFHFLIKNFVGISDTWDAMLMSVFLTHFLHHLVFFGLWKIKAPIILSSKSDNATRVIIELSSVITLSCFIIFFSKLLDQSENFFLPFSKIFCYPRYFLHSKLNDNIVSLFFLVNQQMDFLFIIRVFVT